MSLTIKLLPVIEEPAAEHHQEQSAGEVQPQKISWLFFPFCASRIPRCNH